MLFAKSLSLMGKTKLSNARATVVFGTTGAVLVFHRIAIKNLSNSDDPFVCLSCTNLSLNQEIAALKDELKNVLEVCGKYSALAAEVAAPSRSSGHSKERRQSATYNSSESRTKTKTSETYLRSGNPDPKLALLPTRRHLPTVEPKPQVSDMLNPELK